MINTLLEHVPIKMEVTEEEEMQETEEVVQQQQITAKDLKTKVKKKEGTKDFTEDEADLPEDSEDEEDDDEDDEDEEEDEEDEEESETETDALEIEQEAAMLISSDEEAELEAQKIRFPDKPSSKKSRSDSNTTSRSSSRNSNKSCTSNTSSKAENILVNTNKQEPEKKQRISPRLKALDNNANNSNNNNNTLTTTTTITNTLSQNKKRTLEANNSNKNKQDISCNTKCLQNTNKTSSSNSADSLNNKLEKENLPKSPVTTNSTTTTSTKSRRGSNNSTCSVASTVGSDTAETESCGNIYVFNLQQKLIFNCEFCDLKYGDLDNFGRHLHEAHKLFNFDEDQEKENAPRNMRKSPRNSSNTPNKACDSLKKEPLQSLESLAEPPPVALPLSVLAEPLNSCGNVFMLNHRKLFLVCGYCESKYANLDLFEKHLRQQHRIFEGHCNEVNVVPKVEIKEEDVSMTELLPATQDLIIPQAMVSIPAEIPLDISINPENQHLTEKALEEVDKLSIENFKEARNVDEVPRVNNSLAASSKSNNLEVATASNESVVMPTVASTEIAALTTVAAVENEKPLTPNTNKNKRKSSPAKPSTSPNKRPKRNTRNTRTKSQEKEEVSINEKKKQK